MREALVSIITPAYNAAALIGETIESVRNQTYERWEMLVVDDGSTDSTVEIVKKYAEEDSRIRIVALAYNSGRPAIPRNYGVKQARGEFIAFLDSDDLWLPRKLEKEIEHMKVDGIACVACDEIPIGDVVYSRNYSFFLRKGVFRDYSYHSIALENHVATSSVITKKEYLDKVGGFDEDPVFKFIEDWELWLRMTKIGKIRILSEPLIKYRITKDNHRDLRSVKLGTLRIFEKHYRLGYLDDDGIMRRALGNCYVDIGKAFLDANDPCGVQQYKMGLRYCCGFHNKMRSIIGLALFYVPEAVRPRIIFGLYQLNAFLTKAVRRFLSV